MKRLIVLASALLLLATLAVVWSARRSPTPLALTPTISGQPEYCLTCHNALAEISPSHPIETFGCVSCHGGERLALDKDLAHSGMRGGRNPSELAVAEASCGGSDCHSGSAADERDHIQRVSSSLQATYAGAIASLRYTFGAQPDLYARVGAIPAQAGAERPRLNPSEHEVTLLEAFDPAAETNPSLQKFAANCLTCHLSAAPIDGEPYARFGGCSACHTPTAGKKYIDEDARAAGGGIHTLTLDIPYNQCNACHNRGNYDLREMTFVERVDNPHDRLNDYYQPIATFTRCEYELDCIDCHTRQEAMGDGHIYNNQKENQYVQCLDCHGTLTDPPHTQILTDLDDIAFRLAFLNPVVELKVGDTIAVTTQGEPIWNMRQLADGAFELVGKATGERYAVPLVQGSACTQKPDEQESRYCHECHAVER